jgi:Arc/MetJ-type ribon-helix-helix transcriptional regulator
MVTIGETTMALELSPRIQARIAEMVEHGDYPDADALLERALELLSEQERLIALKKLIAVGVEEVAQGKVVEFTPERREKLWQQALQQADAGHGRSRNGQT